MQEKQSSTSYLVGNHFMLELKCKISQMEFSMFYDCINLAWVQRDTKKWFNNFLNRRLM